MKPSTCYLLLLFIVLGVYYPSIFSPINSVDDSNVLLFLQNSDSLSLFRGFFPGGSGSYYRPILLATYLVDKFVWGLEESFLHLDNILFHLANTLLLYAMARRAAARLPGTSTLAPFVAALFFALHPLNTESVNWISGRTDLLACFFLLLSMHLMLRVPLTWQRSFAAATCMLLACLAKETAIFFLPAALLFPFFLGSDGSAPAPLGTVLRRSWLHCSIFCLAAASYFAFRFLAFSSGDQGVARVVTHVGGSESAGAFISARLILKATGFYAKKLLVPFPLNFGIIHVSDLYWPLGIVVLAGILWLMTRRTLPAFFVVCAGAVGTSALMIPLLRLTWTPLGERYMYIPSAFFLTGLTLASERWLRQREVNRTGCVLLVGTLLCIAIYGTASRNILWQDNLALFRDTLRKSPDFTPAQNEIANALYDRGQRDEAAVIYKSFRPTEGLINAQLGLMNKAFALMHEGSFAEARLVLRDLQANPGKHELSILKLVLELDKLQVQAKKATPREVYAESVAALTRLVELTRDPFYSYRLGIVHLQVGARPQALAAFNAVVRSAPETAYYRKPAQKLALDLAK